MRSKIARRILADTPEDTKIFVSLYADILVRIKQLMKEKELTQKSFAEKLDKRPSEINKWLTGDHNFTIKSLAKMQAELGEPIIYVPKRVAFAGNERVKKHFTVYKNEAVDTNIKFDDGQKTLRIPNRYQPLAYAGE
ncbi:MAG: helix-turn-helix transcriptional regulator [Flavobacteriaceae bacterium]|nr:helix-turn-helix transcriptional regulator [Flavobacteriaceae bacterium]